jgi:hypothetical protein
MTKIETNVPHPTRRAIVNELYFALSMLGAPGEMLAIVGTGDTMDAAGRSIISERSIATSPCSAK